MLLVTLVLMLLLVVLGVSVALFVCFFFSVAFVDLVIVEISTLLLSLIKQCSLSLLVL